MIVTVSGRCERLSRARPPARRGASVHPAPAAHTSAPCRPDTLAPPPVQPAVVCCTRGGSRRVAWAGAGAGQMDRLASCRLAIEKAADRAKGAVVGSDAFFPFRDGPDQLIAAGVRAIVQPGGSKKDDEVIAAADKHKIAMVFTGKRHFKH